MKWPNDGSAPRSIIEKMNDRIKRFLDEDPSENGGADCAAVKELIVDLQQIWVGDVPRIEQEERLKSLQEFGSTWDTDDPQLTHIQKYLNRLLSDEETRATDYISAVIEQRAKDEETIGRQALSESGTKGGKKKHETTNRVKEAAILYYEQHKQVFTSKKEAARYLEQKFPPIKFSTYYRFLSNLRR